MSGWQVRSTDHLVFTYDFWGVIEKERQHLKKREKRNYTER
jgi:hypothetical protein